MGVTRKPDPTCPLADPIQAGHQATGQVFQPVQLAQVVEPQGRQNLVVAGAPNMDLLAEITELLGQRELYRCMQERFSDSLPLQPVDSFLGLVHHLGDIQPDPLLIHPLLRPNVDALDEDPEMEMIAQH